MEESSGQLVSVSIKQFLVLEHCSPAWRTLDLYIFRDGNVYFYVGQSHLAYDRVWQHVHDGFKARSIVGRFILCNWPGSMGYTIDLLSSRSERFAGVHHDLDAAERLLIEQCNPCFNTALNNHPAVLPARYTPPGPEIRCSRNLNRLIRQAGIALQADRRKHLLAELDDKL